jgi:hypothetical protein
VKGENGNTRRKTSSLYNQQAPIYTMFFIIISTLHVSGGFSANHQELIKLYVQPWVLLCFPAVYRLCGWFGTVKFKPTLLGSCHQKPACNFPGPNVQ